MAITVAYNGPTICNAMIFLTNLVARIGFMFQPVAEHARRHIGPCIRLLV